MQRSKMLLDGESKEEDPLVVHVRLLRRRLGVQRVRYGSTGVRITSVVSTDSEDIPNVVAETKTGESVGGLDVIFRTQLGQDTLEVEYPGGQELVLVFEVCDTSEAVGGFVDTRSAPLATCRACRPEAVTLSSAVSGVGDESHGRGDGAFN